MRVPPSLHVTMANVSHGHVARESLLVVDVEEVLPANAQRNDGDDGLVSGMQFRPRRSLAPEKRMEVDHNVRVTVRPRNAEMREKQSITCLELGYRSIKFI